MADLEIISIAAGYDYSANPLILATMNGPCSGIAISAYTAQPAYADIGAIGTTTEYKTVSATSYTATLKLTGKATNEGYRAFHKDTTYTCNGSYNFTSSVFTLAAQSAPPKLASTPSTWRVSSSFIDLAFSDDVYGLIFCANTSASNRNISGDIQLHNFIPVLQGLVDDALTLISHRTKTDLSQADGLKVVSASRYLKAFSAVIRIYPQNSITLNALNTSNTTSPVKSHAIYNITFGNGVYIGLIGAGISRSTDGLTWTKVQVWPTDTVLTLLGYGGVGLSYVGTWLLADTAGQVYRSPDNGVTWIQVGKLPGLGHQQLLKVDGAWLVIANMGDGGTVYRSTNDGLSWSAVSMGAQRQLTTAAVGGGIVVAMGHSGEIVRSTNAGSSWSRLTPMTSFNYRSVVYGNSRFIALTNENTVVRSVSWPTMPPSDIGAAWEHSANGYVRVHYTPTPLSSRSTTASWNYSSPNVTTVRLGFSTVLKVGNVVQIDSTAVPPYGGIYAVLSVAADYSFTIQGDLPVGTIPYGGTVWHIGDIADVPGLVLTHAYGNGEGGWWNPQTKPKVFGSGLVFGNGKFVSSSGLESTDGVSWTQSINVFSEGSIVYGTAGWVSTAIGHQAVDPNSNFKLLDGTYQIYKVRVGSPVVTEVNYPSSFSLTASSGTPYYPYNGIYALTGDQIPSSSSPNVLPVYKHSLKAEFFYYAFDADLTQGWRITSIGNGIAPKYLGNPWVSTTAGIPLVPKPTAAAAIKQGQVFNFVGGKYQEALVLQESPEKFPTTFAISNPTQFPALSINNSGVISGILPTLGSSSVGITVKNSLGSSTGSITINVTAGRPVVLSDQSFIYTAGTPATKKIQASSAFLPTAWAISPTTPLPAGLNLNTSTGEISGTPTALTTPPALINSTGIDFTKIAASALTYNGTYTTNVDKSLRFKTGGTKHVAGNMNRGDLSFCLWFSLQSLDDCNLIDVCFPLNKTRSRLAFIEAGKLTLSVPGTVFTLDLNAPLNKKELHCLTYTYKAYTSGNPPLLTGYFNGMPLAQLSEVNRTDPTNYSNYFATFNYADAACPPVANLGIYADLYFFKFAEYNCWTAAQVLQLYYQTNPVKPLSLSKYFISVQAIKNTEWSLPAPIAIETAPPPPKVKAGQTFYGISSEALTYTALLANDPLVPVSWSSVDLSPGLVLSAAGIISGSLTADNSVVNSGVTTTYSFTIIATSSGGSTSEKINAVIYPKPRLSESTLFATVGVSLKIPITLSPSEVTNPLQLPLKGVSLSSGTLPPGLELKTYLPSTTGGATTVYLEGTPTTKNISATFMLRAEAGNSYISSFSVPKAVTISIAAGIPSITETGTFVFSNGVPFSKTVSISDAANLTPDTWSATGLPAGLTIANSGVISGTPTSTASTYASITAQNAAGISTKAIYFSYTTASGGNYVGIVGVPLNVAVAGNIPGRNIDSWVTSVFPTWMTFNLASSSITGTPTTKTSTSFTVSLTPKVTYQAAVKVGHIAVTNRDGAAGYTEQNVYVSDLDKVIGWDYWGKYGGFYNGWQCASDETITNVAADNFGLLVTTTKRNISFSSDSSIEKLPTMPLFRLGEITQFERLRWGASVIINGRVYGKHYMGDGWKGSWSHSSDLDHPGVYYGEGWYINLGWWYNDSSSYASRFVTGPAFRGNSSIMRNAVENQCSSARAYIGGINFSATTSNSRYTGIYAYVGASSGEFKWENTNRHADGNYGSVAGTFRNWRLFGSSSLPLLGSSLACLSIYTGNQRYLVWGQETTVQVPTRCTNPSPLNQLIIPYSCGTNSVQKSDGSIFYLNNAGYIHGAAATKYWAKYSSQAPTKTTCTGYGWGEATSSCQGSSSSYMTDGNSTLYVLRDGYVVDKNLNNVLKASFTEYGTKISLDFVILGGTPSLTKNQTFTVTTGEAYSKQVDYVADVNRPIISWGATGLPAGLSISPITGIISGVTSVSASTITINVTAKGEGGGSSSETYTMYVRTRVELLTKNQILTGKAGTVWTAQFSKIVVTGWDSVLWKCNPALPNGLTLNTTTGIISGTPSTFTGNYYSTFIWAEKQIDGFASTPIEVLFNIGLAAPKLTSTLRSVTLMIPSSIQLTSWSAGPVTTWTLKNKTTSVAVSTAPAQATYTDDIATHMTIDKSTGLISAELRYPLLPGNYTFTVTLVGPGGTSTGDLTIAASQTYNTINPPYTPTTQTFTTTCYCNTEQPIVTKRSNVINIFQGYYLDIVRKAYLSAATSFDWGGFTFSRWIRSYASPPLLSYINALINSNSNFYLKPCLGAPTRTNTVVLPDAVEGKEYPFILQSFWWYVNTASPSSSGSSQTAASVVNVFRGWPLKATGLPAGLDLTLWWFTGKPTEAGTYTISISRDAAKAKWYNKTFRTGFELGSGAWGAVEGSNTEKKVKSYKIWSPTEYYERGVDSRGGARYSVILDYYDPLTRKKGARIYVARDLTNEGLPANLNKYPPDEPTYWSLSDMLHEMPEDEEGFNCWDIVDAGGNNEALMVPENSTLSDSLRQALNAGVTTTLTLTVLENSDLDPLPQAYTVNLGATVEIFPKYINPSVVSSGRVTASIALGTNENDGVTPTLPPGTSYSAQLCKVVGKTTKIGEYWYYFKSSCVVNQVEEKTQQRVYISVIPEIPIIGPNQVFIGFQDDAFTGYVSVTNPYESQVSYFTFVSGNLPPGLTLSPGNSGALTGTPTSPGNFKFIVTATGGGGTSLPVEITITILKGIAKIVPNQRFSITAGKPFSFDLLTIGGVPTDYLIVNPNTPGLGALAPIGTDYKAISIQTLITDWFDKATRKLRGTAEFTTRLASNNYTYTADYAVSVAMRNSDYVGIYEKIFFDIDIGPPAPMLPQTVKWLTGDPAPLGTNYLNVSSSKGQPVTAWEITKVTYPDGTVSARLPGLGEWRTSTAVISAVPMWMGALGYGDGKFVVVGRDCKTAYSGDGINWKAGTFSGVAPTNAGWVTNIVYGAGKFVAMLAVEGDTYSFFEDRTDKMAYSYNGIDWVLSSSPGPVPKTVTTKRVLAYGAGKFVCLWGGRPDGGTYKNSGAYSIDGETWTAIPNPPICDTSGAATWSSLKYLGGVFVALGYSRNIARSVDGIVWETTILPADVVDPSDPSDLSFAADGVAYGEGKFIAIKRSSSGRSFKVFSSTDAKNWTLLSGVTGLYRDPHYPEYIEGKFVVFDYTWTVPAEPLSLSSLDGITWDRIPGAPLASLRGLQYFTHYGQGVWLSYDVDQKKVYYTTSSMYWDSAQVGKLLGAATTLAKVTVSVKLNNRAGSIVSSFELVVLPQVPKIAPNQSFVAYSRAPIDLQLALLPQANPPPNIVWRAAAISTDSATYMPWGVVLSASGKITGAITKIGTYTPRLAVQATDTVSTFETITIQVLPGPPELTDSQVLTCFAGKPANLQLTVVDPVNNPPGRWEVTPKSTWVTGPLSTSPEERKGITALAYGAGYLYMGDRFGRVRKSLLPAGPRATSNYKITTVYESYGKRVSHLAADSLGNVYVYTEAHEWTSSPGPGGRLVKISASGAVTDVEWSAPDGEYTARGYGIGSLTVDPLGNRLYLRYRGNTSGHAWQFVRVDLNKNKAQWCALPNNHYPTLTGNMQWSASTGSLWWTITEYVGGLTVPVGGTRLLEFTPPQGDTFSENGQPVGIWGKGRTYDILGGSYDGTRVRVMVDDATSTIYLAGFNSSTNATYAKISLSTNNITYVSPASLPVTHPEYSECGTYYFWTGTHNGMIFAEGKLYAAGSGGVDRYDEIYRYCNLLGTKTQPKEITNQEIQIDGYHPGPVAFEEAFSLNPTTGLITGTPTKRKTFQVNVGVFKATAPHSPTGILWDKDENNPLIPFRKNVTIVVEGGVPALTANQIFYGYVGQYTSITLGLVDAENSPASWYKVSSNVIDFLAKDGTLTTAPKSVGLVLNETTGIISGIPTFRTTQTIGITTGAKAGYTVGSVKIIVAGGATKIIENQVFNGMVATDFDAVVAVENILNNPVTSWTSPNLPADLVINSLTGKITGKPKVKGTYTVAISAQGDLTKDTKNITIKVGEDFPIIAPNQTLNGKIGQAFSGTLNLVDGDTRPACSWSVTPSLPAGLSLNTSTGLIGGTPEIRRTTIQQATAYNCVKVSGGAVPFTVVIDYALPEIVAGQTFTGKEGEAFTGKVLLKYNDANITMWEAYGLPAELTISAVGLITGTPTTYGIFTCSVKASSGLISSTSDIVITLAQGSLKIVENQVFTGEIGVSFNNQVTLVSGIAVLWTAKSGLPAGLTLNSSTGVVTGTPTTSTSSAGVGYSIQAYDAEGSTSTKTVKFIIAAATPTITANQTILGVVGVNLNKQIAATSFSQNPIKAWSVTGSLPQGLQLSQTGVVSGIPASPYDGVIVLNVEGNTRVTSQNVTVKIIGGVPVITSNQIFNAKVRQAFVGPVVFTDSATRPVEKCKLTGLPAGLSFNAADYTITGIPEKYGTFTPAVEAENAAGKAQLSITIVVGYGAPIIVKSQVAYAEPGKLLNYTLELKDVLNCPATSWTATDLPAGITLDSAAGILSGTLSATTESYLTATGLGGVSDAEKVVLLSVKPVYVYKNTLNSVVSVDEPSSSNPIVFWTLKSGTLPDGLRLAPYLGLIEGVPRSFLPALVRLEVLRDDSTVEEITIVVAVLEAVPTIDSNQVKTYKYNENVEDLTLSFTGVGLSFQVVGLPSGLTLHPLTGKIYGTPTKVGVFPSTVTVTNTSGTASAIVNFYIIADFAAPILTEILTPITGKKNEYLTEVRIQNTGGPIATWNCSTLPAGIQFNTTTAKIYGAPSVFGDFDISISADNAIGSSSITFKLIISPDVTKPVILPNQDFTVFVGDTLAGSVSSLEGPIANYSLTGTLPDGVLFNSTTGKFSGTPTVQGDYAVLVEASNYLYTSDSEIVNITVNSKRSILPPAVISGQTFTFKVGEYAKVQIQTDAAFGEAASWKITTGTNLPSKLNLSLVSGEISGIADAVGTYTASVTAQTAKGLASSAVSITVVVEKSLYAPEVTKNQIITVKQNAKLNEYLLATNTPTSWVVTQGVLPVGVSLTSLTGILVGITTATGTYIVKVEANNIYGSSSEDVTLIVELEAPEILENQTVTEVVGAPLTYTIKYFNGLPTSWSVLGSLPGGLTLNTATGVLTGAFTAAGSYTAQVTASNAGGSSTKTVTFNATNPVNMAVTTNQKFVGKVGVFADFYLTSTGPAPTLWAATALPTGLVIDGTTGKISGTPKAAGNTTVTITISNPKYSSQSGSISIQIYSSTTSLKLVASQVFTYPKGQLVKFTPAVIGVPTSWDVKGLPVGLTVNKLTGEVTGSVTTSGLYTLTCICKDAVSTVSGTLKLTIS